MNITLERELTVTAAAPLTEAETDALIGIAAASEKTARVKGGLGSRTSRGWSFGGNVD